jgi:integrase
MTPYIFTRDELRRVLDATARSRTSELEPSTMRVLLLLLYGAALRLGEALGLTIADVDLDTALLTIRDTKFYKTRLVPVGPDLCRVLQQYAEQRRGRPVAPPADATFLTGRSGRPLRAGTVRRAFARLRQSAGVRRTDGARYQPRLHDLRHTFVGHRVTTWYRSDAPVQQWLAPLSSYLGHGSIAATQVYHTMTPELLREA